MTADDPIEFYAARSKSGYVEHAIAPDASKTLCGVTPSAVRYTDAYDMRRVMIMDRCLRCQRELDKMGK